MDEFLTDDEQAVRAKQWLRENGLFVAAGVVLGLGVLFGWQRWESFQQEQSGQASVVWEQLTAAISGERPDEMQQTLQILADEYAATPYLAQARLAVAKYHMEHNEADLALEQLNAVAQKSSDPQLRRIAELRVAQIYVYLERYADALAILDADDDTAFAPQAHDLRGDVYFAQGKPEAARDEYRLALEKDTAAILDRSFVQMKLDDVAGSIAAMPADELSADQAAAATE